MTHIAHLATNLVSEFKDEMVTASEAGMAGMTGSTLSAEQLNTLKPNGKI